jgi:hypothetical protein
VKVIQERWLACVLRLRLLQLVVLVLLCGMMVLPVRGCRLLWCCCCRRRHARAPASVRARVCEGRHVPRARLLH